MSGPVAPPDDLSKPAPRAQRRCRGFETAAALVARRIGSVGERRGFSAARLLTNWAEVVGEETASRCRPVRISHRRGGFGATLVLLTAGAEAPRLEMALPGIRARVNACYGFNAVARITLTQTAADGFSEGQADFLAPPSRRRLAERAAPPPAPDRRIMTKAASAAEGIDDPDLAAAIARLTYLYLSRRDAQERGSP